MVQWLKLGTFIAVDMGSIPGLGTKIPKAKLRSHTIIIIILYIYIDITSHTINLFPYMLSLSCCFLSADLPMLLTIQEKDFQYRRVDNG